MKDFEAPIPNIGSPAVQPLRTRDVGALTSALAAVKPPYAADVAAELIAIAYAHDNPNVRKKAMGLVTKHVPDAAQFKAAYKSLPSSHIAEERVRAFDHPYRLDVCKGMMFHRQWTVTIPFEQDAAARAALLDIIVDRAKREGESEVKLGDLYWRWKNQGGWTTGFDHHVLPLGLFGELTKLRSKHPFTGVSLHGGSLTDLPADIVEAKGWLTSLSLAFNPFVELPDVLWELENLEDLDLLGTELPDITDDIAKLPKLRKLDIGNMKKMKEVPASVCKLDKLEELRISNGSIRKVPEALADMKGLRAFQLQSTSVAKLPKRIASMPSLKHITIRYSKVDDATAKSLTDAGVTVER